jgi:four helix bundle protein
MAFKFENLEVWKLSLEYLDAVYHLADDLPKEEMYNLRSQWVRAATSISLNIAEGSTGQTDSEQVRFLGYAIRSLMESTACFRIAQRRNYLKETIEPLDDRTLTLIRKLQSFRNSVQGKCVSNMVRPSSMVHRPSSVSRRSGSNE